MTFTLPLHVEGVRWWIVAVVPLQASKPDLDRPNDSNPSDPENNGDNNNNSPQDTPMDAWEEFDEDVVYQKKHIDPEMRQ